jgi:hypothetical protein
MITEAEEPRISGRTRTVACQFLHRDEFHRLHPESKDELPAVFIENQGELHPCISAAQLETCDNMKT